MEKQNYEAADTEQLTLDISVIKQVSSDCIEITIGDGPVFFIFYRYLSTVCPDQLKCGYILTPLQAAELMTAGCTSAAERKAVEYLARAEQCRFGLEQKLLRKGFSRETIGPALDYLESVQYLDDCRFAGAWLRIHSIAKPQGRIRLEQELLSRGISRENAHDALDSFFLQYDEAGLCHKACDRAVSQGKKDMALTTCLLRSGFSYKMIKKVLTEQNTTSSLDK
jgi:regulatory protein